MNFYQSAYDLKFFNFTAEQISSEREHLVHNLISKAIENAIQKIETPATSALLGAQKDAVISRVEAATKKNMQSLRLLDKKYFHIPSHVLQVEDFHLEHQPTPLEEEKKNNELEHLKLRFRQNLITLAKVEAEGNHYASVAKIAQEETDIHKQVYKDCKCIKLSMMAEVATLVATMSD
ncbi:GL19253 [Drosophila persimilis]|uniref:GL19253 n=1 Tax=Drosophila persimilis TaxID=7234 RepID=B4G883_DROPE|nr:uncharacterized protein LOC6588975 [Drosophila persimilis]EDW28563.1 GL19253 [Drosophila persimilis]